MTGLIEIGFIHLPATLMRCGTLDNKFCDENYKNEKRYVENLLDAKCDIDDIRYRSQDILRCAIQKEFSSWWLRSFYCAELIHHSAIVMKRARDELIKLGAEIISFSEYKYSIIVKNFSYTNFQSFQYELGKNWKLMIYYKELSNFDFINC